MRPKDPHGLNNKTVLTQGLIANQPDSAERTERGALWEFGPAILCAVEKWARRGGGGQVCPAASSAAAASRWL